MTKFRPNNIDLGYIKNLIKITPYHQLTEQYILKRLYKRGNLWQIKMHCHHLYRRAMKDLGIWQ